MMTQSNTANGYTLITGASGFVGSALAKLLAPQRPIVCLSRQIVDFSVPSVAGEFHSLEDLSQLDAYEITSVVHLAAVTGGCSEEDGLAVNVLGTRRLIRYLLDRGCRKFVLASSIAAVGSLQSDFIPLQLPMPDEHPCLARDAYGLSKWMMEELTRYFARLTPDAEFTNLRLGAVVDDAQWTPPRTTVGAPLSIPFVQMGHVLLSDVLGAIQAVLQTPLRPGAHVYNVVAPDAASEDAVIDVLRAQFSARLDALDLSWYEQSGHEHGPLYAMDKIRNELGFVPQQSTRPYRKGILNP